jgi:hypothetical protein
LRVRKQGAELGGSGEPLETKISVRSSSVKATLRVLAQNEDLDMTILDMYRSHTFWLLPP